MVCLRSSLKAIVLLAALSGASQADDNGFHGRQCANRCVYSIYEYGHKPHDHTHPGIQDCSAAFQKTVLPCTATSTVTATASTTVTASTDTIVETSSVTVTSTTTAPSDVTRTVSTTATTSDVSILSPTTTTTTATAAKRGATTGTVQSCTPQVISSTTVPAPFTSACWNIQQFSTACSCLGVAHSTITASAPTVTVTTTSTNTILVTTSTTTSTTATVTIPATVYTPTTDATATATTTVPCNTLNPSAEPTCQSLDGGGLTYWGYIGQTYQENFDGEPATVYSSFEPCLTSCQAINECINTVGGENSLNIFFYNPPSGPQQWICQMVDYTDFYTSSYSGYNASIVVSYLYTFQGA